MSRKKLIFKNASTTYFYSSLFFPKDTWEKVATLYAYVRTADDFVDEVPQQPEAFAAFVQETQRICEYYALAKKVSSSWKAGRHLVAEYHQRTEYTDIIQPFVELMFAYHISFLWVHAFLYSMMSDLSADGDWIRYTTRKEVNQYIYGSAEVIGLMMSQILGLPKQAQIAARKQGAAMQQINFIRDIHEDCELHRTYMASEVLEKYGLSKLCDIPETSNRHHQFAAFIRDEISLYRITQTEAEKGYGYIPYRYRIPIATAARLYAWTADQIEADPHIVFRKKVKPSKYRVFGTLLVVALREAFR